MGCSESKDVIKPNPKNEEPQLSNINKVEPSPSDK